MNSKSDKSELILSQGNRAGCRYSGPAQVREDPITSGVALEHLEVARMVIEHGADVSVEDKDYGNTPLHLASFQGNVEVTQMLIKHGADATARNKDRKTALHLASTHFVSDRTSTVGRSCPHTSRTLRKCDGSGQGWVDAT